jgi:hypothetical protein
VRHDVDRVLVGTAVRHADPDPDVRGAGFGVVDVDRPVPVVVEDPGVHEFVLGFGAGPLLIRLDEVLVRERGLGVVVAPRQPRVAGGRIGEPPVLLHVLAVFALGTTKPEHPLLDVVIAAVPQR